MMLVSKRPTMLARSGAPRALRSLSYSAAMASRDQPQWLQKVLNDTEPAPRRYAWTLNNLESDLASKATQLRQRSVQNDATRRVFVMGLGNLGRLYATALAQLSTPPPITLVVHRRNLLEHWASYPGIEMTRYGHLERLSNFDIEWWTDEKPTVGPVQEVAEGDKIHNIILATKAPDAMSEIDRLRRYLDGSSTVVFVQNGMNRLWPPHGAVYAAHRYPSGNHPNFSHGITTHGVFSEGPFRSVHASPADVVIGPVKERSNAAGYLTKLVTTAPHLAGRAVARPELWVLQLEKLVVNMIINPLTAILRVRNGELFADRASMTVKVMDQLLDETSRVLQALVRHESSREILQGSDKSLETVAHRFTTTALRDLLHRVGEKTKLNKSSMFQDVEASKRTEIRDFNGWLIETADFLNQGLDVGSHKFLVDLVEQGVHLDDAELGRRLLGCVR